MLYERQGDAVSPDTLIGICQAVKIFAQKKEPGKYFTIESMYTDSNPDIIHLEISFQQNPDYLQAGDYRQLVVFIKGYSDEILDADAYREALKKYDIAVFCDSTDLYTDEEIEVDNLTSLEFPRYIIVGYLNQHNVSQPMSFDEFLEEYTATTTEFLYDYAKSKGYQAKRAA